MNGDLNRLPARLRSAVRGLQLAYDNLLEQLNELGDQLHSKQQTSAELAELRQVQSGLPGQRLIPLPRWEEYYPWPSTNALYHLVADADSNGFHAVVRRQGKRLFIDEAAFHEWQKTHSTGQEPPQPLPIPAARRGRRLRSRRAE
jgi:hypothetical protein